MKRFYTALAVCLLLANTVEAQVPKRASHEEYLLYVSAGASNLKYSLANGGEAKGGTGFGAGMEYVCNVSYGFGFSMCAELSSFHGKAMFKSLTETYDAIDDMGKAMEYSYSIDNYTEKQNMMLLSIPILVRFKVPAGRRSSFYFAGGMKFGFPVLSESKASGENLRSTGYYRHENITYSDLPEHGFFSGVNISGEKSVIKGFSTMTTATVEAGMRFSWEKHVLYAGAYCDYLFNYAIPKSRHPLNYSQAITYESVLNSPLSSKLNMMSIGLKVRFSIF